MINLFEKIGDYFFRWAVIWYRILSKAGLFCLVATGVCAQVAPVVVPVAQGLTVPWDMEWLGEGEIIFSEMDGRISKVRIETGEVTTLYRFDDVARELQAGLLGLALHPDFSKHPIVYAAYTVFKGDALALRVVKLLYAPGGQQLVFSKIIVDDIPAAPTDVGGRLLATADGKLFLSVGDNEMAERAQDITSLNGKILRYNLDGSIPADNPFPGSPVWALGIRNSQGLAQDTQGRLFFSEHGTMSEDELNLLLPGGNYGWHLVAGYCDVEPPDVCKKISHREPLRSWTPTIAPAGIAYYGSNRYPALTNTLLMANLFDQRLKCIFFDETGTQVKSVVDYISEMAGRLRDVLVSPDGRVFVSTSNADTYGAAPKGSDLILELRFDAHEGTIAESTASHTELRVPDDTLRLDSTLLEIRILAKGLVHPWDMTWGFDNRIWVTENGGWVKRLDPANGQLDTILHLSDCHYSWGNPGVYSLAFHPDFPEEPFLFVHYTDSPTNSKLVRFRYDFDNDALTDGHPILPKITANESHNGSRMVFTLDGKMFFAMGEAYTPELAQDLNSLNGKILRLNLDGSVPEDNPFPGSLIWSFGHRNPQGLALLPNGTLWSSEHGANNDDELNIILKGRNYGWPKVQGFCDLRSEQRFCNENQVVEPIVAWTPTVAPCALEYYNHEAIPEWRHSLMQVFLKKGKGKIGQRMTVFHLNKAGDNITYHQDYFVETYGRLRDVLIAPDGRVFICTSNKEVSGNGKKVVQPDDDKIIELRPGKR